MHEKLPDINTAAYFYALSEANEKSFITLALVLNSSVVV
jgi:hypothetical protein